MACTRWKVLLLRLSVRVPMKLRSIFRQSSGKRSR